jgi:hypothetical protein
VCFHFSSPAFVLTTCARAPCWWTACCRASATCAPRAPAAAATNQPRGTALQPYAVSLTRWLRLCLVCFSFFPPQV